MTDFFESTDFYYNFFRPKDEIDYEYLLDKYGESINIYKLLLNSDYTLGTELEELGLLTRVSGLVANITRAALAGDTAFVSKFLPIGNLKIATGIPDDMSIDASSALQDFYSSLESNDFAIIPHPDIGFKVNSTLQLPNGFESPNSITIYHDNARFLSAVEGPVFEMEEHISVMGRSIVYCNNVTDSYAVNFGGNGRAVRRSFVEQLEVWYPGDYAAQWHSTEGFGCYFNRIGRFVCRGGVGGGLLAASSGPIAETNGNGVDWGSIQNGTGSANGLTINRANGFNIGMWLDIQSMAGYGINLIELDGFTVADGWNEACTLGAINIEDYNDVSGSIKIRQFIVGSITHNIDYNRSVEIENTYTGEIIKYEKDKPPPTIIIPPASLLLLGTSTPWFAANSAIFLRFTLEKLTSLRYFLLQVDVSSGQYQVGVVKLSGTDHLSYTRVMNSTAINVPTAGQHRIDLGLTELDPGDYAVFVWFNNTTAEVRHTTSAGITAMRLSATVNSLTGGVQSTGTLPAWSSRYIYGVALEADV